MIKDAVENLKNAVESSRTDILRSILSHCEKEVAEDGDSLVTHVLSDLSCDVGTVLHLATQLADSDAVRALLAAGADPCIQNSQGKTPVDLATSQQVKDVFNQELLQSTAQSNIGRVCQLLAAGVNVNLQDSPISQNTPLHWAASYANHDMVQSLCDRGANVNAVNSNGFTPLHDAVKRSDVQIIEELVLNDADPSIKVTSGNDAGLSAYDMAAGNADALKALSKPPVKLITDLTTELDECISGKGPTASKIRVASSASLDSETSNSQNGSLSQNQEQHVKQLNDFVHSVSQQTDITSDRRLNLLWPQPQKITLNKGSPYHPKQTISVKVINGPNVALTSDACATWSYKQYNFQKIGYRISIESTAAMNVNIQSGMEECILCQITEKQFTRKESYKVYVTANQVKILASDLPGLNYAISTFIQLLHLCHLEGIPPLQISDWPSLKYRGILLDVSQGRIPKMETLKDFIDSAAILKINQLHLYTRFKTDDENVRSWQLCYSNSEISELSYFCKQRCVTLVPVLDVVPGASYNDIGSLYYIFQDILSCFHDSSIINIGPRLSTFILDTSEENFLDTGDANRLIPFSTQHSLQLCAYVFHDDSNDMVQQLPLNMSLMEYGFQADYDFKAFCKKFVDNGIPFQVCPGTSAWNSVAGCPEAAVSNIYNAAYCAKEYDAFGMVICDWSGKGHMTHKIFSWPGFITGAGMAWNTSTPYQFVQSNLAELLNKHALCDYACVTGQVLVELGRAETFVLKSARHKGNDIDSLPAEHGSTLFQLLAHPDNVSLEHLSPDVFQKARRHIKKCQSELSKSTMQCLLSPHILAELKLSTELLLCACRIGRALVVSGKNPSSSATAETVVNLGVTNLPATTRTDLANRLLGLIENYRTTWLTMNQTTGLQESLLVLSNILKQFLPEGPPQEI